MDSIFFSDFAIARKDPDDDTDYVGSPKLIAIIGDEDTCCGFLLGGIGQLDENYLSPNFFVVDQKTNNLHAENVFFEFLNRPDIGLVLITKEAAEMIGPVVKEYKGIDPVVMVIPGHNGPFEIELPAAIKEIEERKKTKTESRRGSTASVTSVKTIQSRVLSSHSAHSIKSNKSFRAYI